MDTQRQVAVFDIDGTIFRSSLLIELVERLIERGIFPETTRALYNEEYLAWQNRIGGYDRYIAKVVRAFATQAKGISYQAVADIAGEVIEEKKDRVYRYPRELLRDYRAKGYFLLGISRSPKFIVDGFGHEHGFDKVYGTFYTTGPSGNFTGLIEDEELIGNKGAVLTRAMRKENLTLQGSFGIGDTETDISMLEMVDSAVAFNPNQKLLEHARRRGWKTVVERKDVVYEL